LGNNCTVHIVYEIQLGLGLKVDNNKNDLNEYFTLCEHINARKERVGEEDQK